ncbi:hypothetical protein ABIA33_006356 [Streptacidiphilus sp. MAP12-16]|uniref:Rv1733c family protein n=1 Tax=Streptacidiphilus sp. MAP12-16 TaxID=3156300 RepID=UPI003512F253
MATPAATPTPPFPARWQSRLGTALALRRNPLWRYSDSLRSRLRVGLVLGLLAAVGLSAFFALHQYRQDRANELRRDAHLHSVQALVLTAPATPPAASAYAGVTAQVRWSELSGASHGASVTVPDNATVGARVPLWVDTADQISAPPVTAGDSATSAAYLALLLAAGSVAVLLAIHRVVRGWVDRTDVAHWEQDWRLFEPAWSHRS